MVLLTHVTIVVVLCINVRVALPILIALVVHQVFITQAQQVTLPAPNVRLVVNHVLMPMIVSNVTNNTIWIKLPLSQMETVFHVPIIVYNAQIAPHVLYVMRDIMKLDLSVYIA